MVLCSVSNHPKTKSRRGHPLRATGTISSTADTGYIYSDSDWGDLLTGYDGRTISYDSIGNPLSDGKRTYTWEHGRELATVTQDGSTWTNTYGADGLRTKRTDGTTTYRYRYTAGQLATMNIDDDVEMWFMYDDNGPLVIKYGNAESHKVYHYELNLQGDVVAIVSTTGERVVEYTYDAWGNVLSITGSAKDTIGVHNPLRYRGYVYDHETQLYYCQSRYYNPETGRFLNADAFASTGQGLLGNNMFAYCGNNPISRVDDNGQSYTSGQIHDFVIEDICDENPNKKGSRKDNKIIYSRPVFFSTYGYCDVHDSITGEVWELKRFSNAPTCQFAFAHVQLSNYVDGHLENNPNKSLTFGGSQTMISSNVFTKTDSDGRGKYVIGYWDTGVGVLFYDYIYIPSGDEVAVGVAIVIVAALAGWAIGAGAGALIPAFA